MFFFSYATLSFSKPFNHFTPKLHFFLKYFKRLKFFLGVLFQGFTMSSEEPDIGKLHLNVIKLRDHLEKVVLDQYTALIKSEARKKDLTKELERSEARCQELRKVLEQTEAQKNKEDLGGSEAQNKELKNYHGDRGLKKELEFSEARMRELKKELELSEAQKNELKKQLFQREAKNKEVKKQLEQSEAQINGLNENLQNIEAEKIELRKNLQESEAQKKELRNDLQQREAENKVLEKDLYQKEVELQESNELQHNADETVEWLKEERKQWRDQEVKLHDKISILEKQRDTNLKHVDELEVKIHEIEGKFKELEEELGNNKTLNGVLIVNEHEKNVELQEARKALIIGLSDSTSQTCIGVKRMGELDNKPFRSALKRPCPSKRGAGLDDKAKKLCSLWEQHLRDPNWQPFRIIMNEQQKPTEFIDEQDEKLKGLKEEFGEQVFHAVKTALAELNEYNPSGRFPVPELWNFKEKRKATVAEGVSYLMNLWKPNIRTRRSSQIQNNQLRSLTR
ncbi:factor of DNA methylation 1-like isoform X1 [Pyrus x bretschneideri]|uniref:factor of DNA methylation 1-like isoform X1 n=1 Tax=Pyrus x bretschneideri TaxID=225117 RepID=UPI00202F2069|nr:factor of DNA methylation 1-like isoform X1 [Pyrus x bretschneideri]